MHSPKKALPYLWMAGSIGGVISVAMVPALRATDTDDVDSLIAAGQFSEAEQRLRQRISDPTAPVTTDAAIQLEILRRTRYDFSLTADAVLEQIRRRIGDATPDDVRRWRESGDLHARVIDGEHRFFRRSVSNLFRFNDEAKQRRLAEAGVNQQAEDSTPFDLTQHIEQLVQLAASSPKREVFPVRHRVSYGISLRADHPRVRPGAVIRVWLPFPQEYQQQRAVRLISSRPAKSILAKNGTPHRTIYFEQTCKENDPPPQFHVEFEFVTSAYCPLLDATKVEPYDTEGELYRRYTSPRAPHIVFTSEVRRIAQEIVGSETNPLRKTLLIFRWISQNIPWCAEMEYSIIPNLSAKGLTARRGDCGVQGMVFITLCRAAGVPARWQSGWQTRPGEVNMHDWSEFYVEPWGWLPADASYGVRQHEDPHVQDFLCGHMDPYRLIVNLDFAQPLQPAKTSFRSEPNDFQRGEVEIDGHNLYFDEWSWKIDVDTEPLPAS